MKDGKDISRLVGRDPDRGHGGEKQWGQVEAVAKSLGGEIGPARGDLPTTTPAICLGDAAILVSRTGAISNEQREPAVQMVKPSLVSLKLQLRV